MGFAEGEQWWERWQLRVLVLGSLSLQFFLLVAAALRKRRTPPWFKLLTWAAYLGSDALAIYALATLFNRQRRKPGGALPSPRGSAALEVLWAPILLLHLGGQDGITAYSIQDNELWRRHFFAAASQVGIAIYVFRKSWPGGDKRLLQAAILLFVPGILKCLEKPFALWRSSLKSMAVTVGGSKINATSDTSGVPLKKFVQEASSVHFMCKPEDKEVVLPRYQQRVFDHPYPHFVDLPHPYSVRLDILKYVSWRGAKVAHVLVRSGLSRTFDRLYTNYKGYSGALVRAVLLVLTFVAICLIFPSLSRGGHYDGADLKVTYILLCCTAGLEVVSAVTMAYLRRMPTPPWPDQVAQCNLIGYLVHNEQHGWLWRLVCLLLGCRGYLDWLWCMAPSRSMPSSSGITELVHDHICTQWREHIREDVAAYRSFSDSRGNWTLDKEWPLGKREGCSTNQSFVSASSSLRRPFDESVIVWHLATDFCFFSRVDNGSKENRCCREISNYMVYLLLVNPAMLMPGARRRIFTTAYAQVREILVKDDELPEDEDDFAKKKVPRGDKEDIVRMIIQKVSVIKEKDVPPKDKDDSAKKEDVVQTDNKPAEGEQIVEQDNKSREGNQVDSANKEVLPGGKDELPKKKTTSRSCLVEDAWALAKELMDLEEDEMWKVLRGVWVEMLCFSASKCRGYLHAKSLATGGEYLSYVWLLRAYMGMETLAHSMQKLEEGDLGAAEQLAAVGSTVDALN